MAPAKNPSTDVWLRYECSGFSTLHLFFPALLVSRIIHLFPSSTPHTGHARLSVTRTRHAQCTTAELLPSGCTHRKRSFASFALVVHLHIL